MRAIPQRPGAGKHPMKLSTAVTLMVSSVIMIVLAVVYTLYFIQIGNASRDGLEETARAIARTLASTPEVVNGLQLPPREDNRIQPLVSEVTARNNLLFVVVTDMQKQRYSHPNPAMIGKHYIGDDINPALKGKENVAINHGVLGLALRIYTPVYNAQQQQTGVVAVGIPLSIVDQHISQSRWSMFWTLLFSALVAAFGILLLVRALKRILFGLEPYEISSLFEQRQAMLHSLKEGVIAVDASGRITMMNQAARLTLLLPGEVTDQEEDDSTAPHAPLLASLREVLHSGQPIQDREVACNRHLLLCNTLPVHSKGQLIGAICTFRDKTEISLLMQRLDGMVNYVDALRAHSHEFMNKLHVILGLLHMRSYDKLEEYIIQTAHNYQTDIGAIQHKIKSPVIAGFLLGKITRTEEAGHILTLADDCMVPDNPNQQQVTVLITALGNLIENALDAMGQQPGGEISLLLHYQDGWLTGEVSDDGPGIAPEIIQTIFAKGVSTKGENRGVGLFLARQQVEGLGGTLSVESEPGVFTQFFVHIPWDSKRKDR
ncbi:sensor histidine kinase [Shimwellia blattae]|uniref:Sensor histidine kinase DcuS n=1 Tax=Shimwellia blattae (strain ATCC 29907 / DSM 4481 / JCM 1650 / NBRC 105725 / CDC 9005-74) TaxID=630626 RepID=I2BD69_SHIBC|nr:sensor histidine kinase [Shimwellia blattae]AFJ48473.1 sensor protein DcuS [Shimwellia blattae DSM 4481 = NBRC 105725]GAB82548.1 two-component histidine kinase DcuS [Shimwellia blattae DSM 4481 = NBRC 105725]VDY65967.1 Sensor histidine kinase DcuS [Shimwellia blattae]VEC26465.1 Sensor histidine kinase DcuS [Shimwellia blattae]